MFVIQCSKTWVYMEERTTTHTFPVLALPIEVRRDDFQMCPPQLHQHLELPCRARGGKRRRHARGREGSKRAHLAARERVDLGYVGVDGCRARLKRRSNGAVERAVRPRTDGCELTRLVGCDRALRSFDVYEVGTVEQHVDRAVASNHLDLVIGHAFSSALTAAVVCAHHFTT